MPITKILTKAARREVNSDNWPIRRRWMKCWAIGFAVNAQVIVVDTVWRGGSALGIQIFITLITALCSLMFFYVFGVVWDDHSKRQMSYGTRDESSTDTADDAAGDAEDDSSTKPTPSDIDPSIPAAPVNGLKAG